MDYFDSLSAVLNRWSHLGSRTTERGVRLIGMMPSFIKKNKIINMHVLYEPLDDAFISRLEMVIGKPLPSALREFYRKANGFSIFGGKFSMKGLRHDYSRELTDEGMHQPVSLEYENTTNRPKGSTPDMIFFGWYSYDCSNIYTQAGDKRIFMCPRRTVKPTLCEWPDFETFLLSEADRLAALFDEEGHLIDKSATGLPLEALQKIGEVH